MTKLTQWIIIGLLAINAVGVFMLIGKVEKSRISIITENMYNKNDIVTEISKGNSQINEKLENIDKNTWELQDVLLDDFSFYMKKLTD